MDIKEKLIYKKYDVDEEISLLDCSLEMMDAFMEEPWNEEWTLSRAKERINEIMSSPLVSRGYLIYLDNDLVAMCLGRIVTYLDYKELYVEEVSVNKNYQRMGIGTLLFDYVKKELDKEGVSRLSLVANRGFPSELFYKKQGFKEDLKYVFLDLDNH